MKKSLARSWNETSLDSFFFKELSDFDASAIVGGAVVGVNANAMALGDVTSTWATTKTYAKQFVSGGSIAFGRGTATAIGNNPSTNVSVFGTGNIVLAETSTYTTQNKSVSSGFILAIDFP